MTLDHNSRTHSDDASNAPIDLDRRRPDPETLDINALIDSELSRAARERVEARLLTDADSLKDYKQLARLSRVLKEMPVPQSTISPEELASRTIVAASERKAKRRNLTAWGRTAIAALFVATVSLSNSMRVNRPIVDVAQTPIPTRSLEATPAPDLASPEAEGVTETDSIGGDAESPLISRALFVE